MMKNSLILAFLFTAACTTSDATDSSTQRAIIDTPCAVDSDCPAGFECEVEVEHGTTTSFCQADEPADDTDPTGGCPAGYELEVEHGQSFCVPHDAGGGGGGGSDDPAGHI